MDPHFFKEKFNDKWTFIVLGVLVFSIGFFLIKDYAPRGGLVWNVLNRDSALVFKEEGDRSVCYVPSKFSFDSSYYDEDCLKKISEVSIRIRFKWLAILSVIFFLRALFLWSKEKETGAGKSKSKN